MRRNFHDIVAELLESALSDNERTASQEARNRLSDAEQAYQEAVDEEAKAKNDESRRLASKRRKEAYAAKQVARYNRF